MRGWYAAFGLLPAGCAGGFDAPARLTVPELRSAAVEPSPVTRVVAPASADLRCAQPDPHEPWRLVKANDCRGPLGPGEWKLIYRHALDARAFDVVAPRTRSAVVELTPPTTGNDALAIGAVAGAAVGGVGLSMLFGAGFDAAGFGAHAPNPEQDRTVALAGAVTLATGAAVGTVCGLLLSRVGVGRVRMRGTGGTADE